MFLHEVEGLGHSSAFTNNLLNELMVARSMLATGRGWWDTYQERKESLGHVAGVTHKVMQ